MLYGARPPQYWDLAVSNFLPGKNCGRIQPTWKTAKNTTMYYLLLALTEYARNMHVVAESEFFVNEV